MSEKKIGKSKYFLKKQKTENLLRIVYFKCDDISFPAKSTNNAILRIYTTGCNKSFFLNLLIDIIYLRI